MANDLILDVENLLCKKEVILSQDEIVKVALFAIQNGIIKLSICEESSDCFGPGEMVNGYKVVFNETENFVTVGY